MGREREQVWVVWTETSTFVHILLKENGGLWVGHLKVPHRNLKKKVRENPIRKEKEAKSQK